MTYQRAMVKTLLERMNEPRRFLQILTGPRQTGKTTAVRQALQEIRLPFLFAEATKGESDTDWIRANWYRARNQITLDQTSALLVMDEIQYVKNWSAAVKTLWDEDAANGTDLRVVLTGSSATLIQEGLEESLAGRFELTESPHWTYNECRDAFGYTLDDFLFFGGFPGAAALIHDRGRWARYMEHSIIEPGITNDALRLADVRNPELMRRLFRLGASYSAREVSYRKLLGQLDDRGNAATIAHYLHLLDAAGMLRGIPKYDPQLLREKASSPRLMTHDTGLMTASFGRNREKLLSDPVLRGHLVESAVGAYLVNLSYTGALDVFWWRDGDAEVDFVIANGYDVSAIEVKSGRPKNTRGLQEFQLRYPHARTIIVGSPECGLEAFLSGKIPLFD